MPRCERSWSAGFWRERTPEEIAAVVNSWELEFSEQCAMSLDVLPKQTAMLLSAGALVIVCFRQTEPLIEAKASLHQLNAFAETQHVCGMLRIPDEYEVACYLALGYPTSGAPSFPPSMGVVSNYVFRNARARDGGSRRCISVL